MLKVSVIAKSQDAILVVRHTDDSGGEWNIPGGLVEPDETLESAAVREVKEETGLDVDRIRASVALKSRVVTPSKQTMGYLRVIFQAGVVRGNLVVLDKHEIAEARLATLQEVNRFI